MFFYFFPKKSSHKLFKIKIYINKKFKKNNKTKTKKYSLIVKTFKINYLLIYIFKKKTNNINENKKINLNDCRKKSKKMCYKKYYT